VRFIIVDIKGGGFQTFHNGIQIFKGDIMQGGLMLSNRRSSYRQLGEEKNIAAGRREESKS